MVGTAGTPMGPLRSPMVAFCIAVAGIGCAESEPFGPESVEAAVERRFVDAVGGNDSTGDGMTASSAFRTVSRALADIPSVVDRRWIIVLAPGEYAEEVRLQRFVMPSALSWEQLLGSVDSVASITLQGHVEDPSSYTIIAPSREAACVSANGVVLFLEGITCRRGIGRDGVVGAGSTIVFDDVRVIATDTSRSGISLDRSIGYVGGTLLVEGLWVNGMSIRSFSLMRSRTNLHPNASSITVQGFRGRGIFLRDDGILSLFSDADTVRLVGPGASNGVGTAAAVYALFRSTVFFSGNSVVEVSDVRHAFAASHQSGINAHSVLVKRVPDQAVRCFNQSYVIIEEGTYENSNRSAETDGTCSIRL